MRLGLIFSSAYHPGSAAIKFNQRLARREVPSVEIHGSFKLLMSFLGQRNRGKPSGVIRFLAVGSAEPFVIGGTLRIKRYRFFCAVDGSVMFLQLQVTLREQQLDVSIVRLFGCGLLEHLDGSCVLACLESSARLVQACALFD